MIGVFGVFGTVYGTYLLIYHFSRGNGLSIPALILLLLGVPALILSLIWAWSIHHANQRNANNPAPSPVVEGETEGAEETPSPTPVEEPPSPEPIEETPVPSISNEETESEIEIEEKPAETPYPRRTYSSSSSYSYSTSYVKLVGYGPVLRVEGNRIVDMRSNTYYRIEENVVMQDGAGIRYEIRGNQIKDAFGSYLYEISGSNINKVFGGFYASISGNYITVYDLSSKYEMTDSLSKKQILVVAALLFGRY